MKELSRTLAAVAVLGLLVAYVLLFEVKRTPGAPEPRKKVVSLDKERIRQVTLSGKDRETVRLVKEAGVWTLQEPLAAAADPAEVDTLLQALYGLEVLDVVAETGGEPAEYGLESPRLTVSVAIEGEAEPVTVALGDRVPARSGVYARRSSEPRIFTVPPHVEGSLDRKAFDLRDRSLLHIERDDVRTLDISGPEGAYSLERGRPAEWLVDPVADFLAGQGWQSVRSDEGDWALTRPLATPAARWTVDGLVGNLEMLRIESVAAEDAQDLKPYGLARPARTAVLGLSDGTRRTLELGDRVPGKGESVYAREAGSRLVGVIPGAIVEDLAKGMAGVRARRLLEVRVYDVEGIEVQVAGTTRSYTRTERPGDGGVPVYSWKRTAPDAADLDTNKVQDALFVVGGVEVDEFLDAPKTAQAYGLDAPEIKVVLRGGPGREPSWFELGRKDGASYARRSGDAAVLRIDPARADDIVKAFKEL